MGALGAVDRKFDHEYVLLCETSNSNDYQGPAVALGVVAAIEGLYLSRTNWKGAVEAAEARNAMDERRV